MVRVLLVGGGRTPPGLDRPDVEVTRLADDVSAAADLLVVLEDVEAPLTVLQGLVARGAHPVALFVAAPARLGDLRAKLSVAPLVSPGSRVVSSDDDAELQRVIAESLGRIEAERAHRADLAALQEQLPGPARSGARLEEGDGEAQRRLLSVLVQATPNGLVAVNGSEQVVFWNPTATEQFERSAEDVLGHPVGELIPNEPVLRHIRDVWSGGAEAEPCELSLDGPSGRARVLELRPVRLGGSPGALGGALVVRDVTEERRREAMRQSFIAVLGHDLRTPLMSLSTGIALLSRQQRPSEVIELMDRSVRRMREMVDVLLDLARAGRADGLPLQRAPLSLDDLVRRSVDELRLAHPDRELRLEIRGSGVAPLDRRRIDQVVTNLVGNALAHGAADSPVSVRTGGDDQHAWLEVHNEGEPIPDELRERLFDPYSRAEGSSGLGLGLHIVHEIARAHGGSVDIASSADAGTTLRVVLPRRVPES